jgi:hypothetical protein
VAAVSGWLASGSGCCLPISVAARSSAALRKSLGRTPDTDAAEAAEEAEVASWLLQRYGKQI